MRTLWILLFAACTTLSGLELVKNGKSDYTIVVSGGKNPIEALAADELREGFTKVFGITPPFATPGKSHSPRLFVGIRPKNAPALRGETHVIESQGPDIYLYGNGEYGTLWAVYAFLENKLGIRFLSIHDHMYAVSRHDLTLTPFKETVNFAFPLRGLMIYPQIQKSHAFYYRNRQNTLIRDGSRFQSLLPVAGPRVHTSFCFMPPGGSHIVGANRPMEFLKDKHYFKTNPDYFSLNSAGERIPRQLCFGNPELRRELTKNIRTFLRRTGDGKLVTLDANDIGGKFCCCPSCEALEKKYNTPGGPIVDYLIELCEAIADEYPRTTISTMAYRKEQTEVPPANIKKLPENLQIVFAPINDNFLGDWSHRDNQSSAEHLKNWCKISDQVIVWYYPNTYSSPGEFGDTPPMPVGNIDRLVHDIRLMKQAGAAGSFFEHDSGVSIGANFTHLQSYLMLKLFQNPDRDPAPLIDEFTNLYYGPAASAIRQYLAELENERKTLAKTRLFWNYCPPTSMYTYLTPKNLLRWQSLFDRAEKSLSEPYLFRVRQVRLTLDMATLLAYDQLAGFSPEALSRATIEQRIRELFKELKVRYPQCKFDEDGWIKRTRLQAKPVPDQFQKIPSERIIQVNPDAPVRLHPSFSRKDPDAAWQIATVDKLTFPFKIGYYDYIGKRQGVSRTITAGEVKDAQYHFYRVGKIRLTQNCAMWGGSWYMLARMGHRYDFDHPDREYEVWMSLKFDKDLVYCDRVILIIGD